jgi:hypothetical protein
VKDMIPPTPNPWRIVEAQGTRFMVRHADGVVWIVSLPDRTVWLLDPQKVPPWAREPGEYAETLPLF